MNLSLTPTKKMSTSIFRMIIDMIREYRMRRTLINASRTAAEVLAERYACFDCSRKFLDKGQINVIDGMAILKWKRIMKKALTWIKLSENKAIVILF